MVHTSFQNLMKDMKLSNRQSDIHTISEGSQNSSSYMAKNLWSIILCKLSVKTFHFLLPSDIIISKLTNIAQCAKHYSKYYICINSVIKQKDKSPTLVSYPCKAPALHEGSRVVGEIPMCRHTLILLHFADNGFFINQSCVANPTFKQVY